MVVGFLMVRQAVHIDWQDWGLGIPAFMTIIFMPLSYSIANGIGAGFVSYAFIRLVQGRGREVHWLMYVVSGGVRHLLRHGYYQRSHALALADPGYISGVKRLFLKRSGGKLRFIQKEPFIRLWGCGYALENVRNFTAAGIQFHPFFLVFFAWGLLSGRPNSAHLYTQTTR